MNKDCPLRPMYNCQKEGCAWYLVHNKQCAIPLIASELQKSRKNDDEFFTRLADKGIDAPGIKSQPRDRIPVTRQVTKSDSL